MPSALARHSNILFAGDTRKSTRLEWTNRFRLTWQYVISWRSSCRELGKELGLVMHLTTRLETISATSPHVLINMFIPFYGDTWRMELLLLLQSQVTMTAKDVFEYEWTRAQMNIEKLVAIAVREQHKFFCGYGTSLLACHWTLSRSEITSASSLLNKTNAL